MNLANKYRPRKLSEVVGQEAQMEVVKAVIKKGGTWPPAVLLAGPYGTGKTTFARLMGRALLCLNRKDLEPCGVCQSCLSMDMDNHPSFIEIDSATNGSIEKIRELKEDLQYRSTGDLRIAYLDESHMLSNAAQNSFLQTLEPDEPTGVMYFFATTDHLKMLATIRSRCVEIKLRLLTAAEIAKRLRDVAEMESVKYEEKAIRVIASYVRGHVRDSLILFDQIRNMFDVVTEDAVRAYLNLDRYKEVYEFLTTTDRKEALVKLEDLLCNFSPSEITEIIGQILVNAYKIKIGVDADITQVDKVWLTKVTEIHGNSLLEKAEQILTVQTDFVSITYAMATIGAIFVKEEAKLRSADPIGRSEGFGMQRKQK